MPERISIHFEGRQDGGQDVGIHYSKESSEQDYRDELIAKETALQSLAVNVINIRREHGLPVPEPLQTIAVAHTFHDLL